MKLYDEKEAVAYVRSRCGCVGMSDDDILIVIDAIFDYYDENGDLDLDLDFDDDDEIPFFGTHDPEEYLEWEQKMGDYLKLHQVPSEDQVKCTTSTFHDYALI